MEFSGKRWDDDRILNRINSSKRVNSLELFDTYATDALLREVGRFGVLKSIHLTSDIITSKGVSELLENCPLRSCLLEGVPLVDDTLLDNFHSNLELRELYLNGTMVSDKAISKVNELSNLISLDISNTGISDVGIRTISSDTITTISFENCNIYGHGFESWTRNKDKKISFYATGSMLSDDGFKICCSSLKKMWNLNIDKCQLSDDGVLALKGEDYPTSIRVNGNYLTRDGVVWLIKNTGVQSLRIDSGLLTEREIKQFMKKDPDLDIKEVMVLD